MRTSIYLFSESEEFYLSVGRKIRPFNDYDLGSVISTKQNELHEKIDSFSNEIIMANDIELLAENLYQEFFIEPVAIGEEIVSQRTISQKKIKKRIDPFWADVKGIEYIEVDGIVACFSFVFQGETDLFKCRASTFSWSGYPEIYLDESTISFYYEKPLEEMQKEDAKDTLLKELTRDLESIKSGVSYANKDVNLYNSSLKEKCLTQLCKKKEKVESYFEIAKKFEIPIEKKEYSTHHIPLIRKIVPVAEKYDRENYYFLTDNDYNDILSAIKHTASTYERTPLSYKSLHEEDFRNTLLASLNATYKGQVNGETFRHHGKTDICIEQKNRSAFVAECKMWSGKGEIESAIYQLDSYLTWRDCKTALIYFVRRKDFFQVLESAKETVKNISGIHEFKELDKNEYDGLLFSKSNIGQRVRIRIFLFNLYCDN